MQTNLRVLPRLRQSCCQTLDVIDLQTVNPKSSRPGRFFQIISDQLSIKRFLTSSLFFLVLLTASLWFNNLQSVHVFAQVPGIDPGETNDQPKTRSSVVTASVPDIVPPSVPILIAPINTAVLTNNQVSFVFEGSTDNVGVDHYQFWLDGQLLFANLNPLGEITTQYSLTVVGNTFTLLPTLVQTDGDHTWRVVAVDAANNQTTSATWQFSVDSQAPTFLITSIDGQVYSISAQDLLTIPSAAIPVASAEPILSGLGESNSTGVVSVTISGQAAQLITFSLSSTGTWQIQLPSLPYDTTVTLNFTITDPAGNVSVLSDLKLIRPSSPSATPTPTTVVISGTPVPIPSVTPIAAPLTPSPSLPPLPFPLPPLPFPIPSPVQPIVEQITRLGQTPRALLAQMMPVATMASWQRPSLSFFQLVMPLLSTLNWLWLILPIVTCLIWLGRYLPKAISLAGLRQLWWAIGLGQQPMPQGVVIGLPNLKLLPFATLTTISTLPSGQIEISYRLSNHWGEYLPGKLPNGTHQTVVDYDGYLFPAVFNVPAHQRFSTYYLGENWATNDQQPEPPLIIPLLATDQQPRRTPPDWLLHLTHQQGRATFGHFLLMLTTLMLLPSLPNMLALLSLGGLITISKFRLSKRNRQLAKIFNRALEPISTGALIIHSNTNLQQVFAIHHGQLTNIIDGQLLSESTPYCQTLTSQANQVKVSEGVCSLQKGQVVI